MARLHPSLVLSALALTLAAAAPAAAAATDEPPREGPTLGAGLGLGNIFSQCDDDFDCDTILESVSVHAFAGGFAGPRTALVAFGWGMIHRDDEVTITHGLAGGALQQWLTRRLWLKGGAGIARSSFSYDVDGVTIQDDSDIVPGALAAAGLELVVGARSSFDVQIRYGTGLYGDSETRVHKLALAAGLSWR